MKDELGGEIMTKCIRLRVKIWYLIDDSSEDNKEKTTKKFIIKKIKFEHYKNCLEARQLDKKVNYLGKNEVSIEEDYKKFIKNNKLILKTQQSFNNERHVFTKEFNKIVLSSNDDERMHSADLIETYECGTSKDLLSEKEEMNVII